MAKHRQCDEHHTTNTLPMSRIECRNIAVLVRCLIIIPFFARLCDAAVRGFPGTFLSEGDMMATLLEAKYHRLRERMATPEQYFSCSERAKGVHWIIVPAAIILAFVPRALIGLGAPSAIGDGQIYLTIAENILRHGCVSFSDPVSGSCVPSWGGNQLPGYPAFIAAVYSILPHDLTSLVLAQSVVAALAIGYFTFIVERCGGPTLRTWLVAGVLAFSPVAMPWVRLAFTESLAIALAIVMFAELIYSLHLRRLRTVSLSILLVAAIFVRYDAALLALPIAIVAIAIHGVAKALPRGLTICVIVSLPLGIWWLRSVNAGLGAVPSAYVSPLGWPIAKGYTAWWRTWIIHQYQYRESVFVVTTGSYDNIRIPSSAHRDEIEKAKVDALIHELAAYAGKPFPKHIDDDFAVLAEVRHKEEPFYQWLGLPLIRAGIMWFNPFVSSGWPISLLSGDSKDNGGADIYGLIRNSPGRALIKASLAGYRLLILGACVLLLIWSIRSRDGPVTLILTMALAYAIVRTIVFAETGLLENRYLIPAIPFLEFAAIYGTSAWFGTHHSRDKKRDCRRRQL